MVLVTTKEELDELIKSRIVSPLGDGFIITLYNPLTQFNKDVEVQVKEGEILSKLDKVDVASKSNETVEDWIMLWRKKWRGKRAKAMGSKEKCINNMDEFFKLQPSYTKEHVFRARDKYFESLKGDMTYLEQADYFIKKRVINDEGKVETRRTLLTYCEEVLLDDEFGLEETSDTFSVFEDI